MKGSISVLDCTLRDGGQLLENLNSNGIKTDCFDDSEKIRIAELLRDSGVEIIEIGCISESIPAIEEFAIYHRIEDMTRFIPERRNSRQIFTGLYLDPDTPVSHIPNHSPELVDGVREILRYSQLQLSLDHCVAIAKKGYKTFIQPMLTMRYTDDELRHIVYVANEIGAYALYIVDSFGYMDEKDVERLYRFYVEELDPSIKIGFHAHNNMENAMPNAKYFIEKLLERDRIVDACAVGMGQGSGNLQTEVLLAYMNKHCKTSYDINCILEICDILEKFRPNDVEGWGYSPIRFVPTMHEAAYKYATAMRIQHSMSLVEINKALEGISDDLRHRYTVENLNKLLENYPS